MPQSATASASLSHVPDQATRRASNAQGMREAERFAVHQEGGETWRPSLLLPAPARTGATAPSSRKGRGGSRRARRAPEPSSPSSTTTKPVPRALFLSHEPPELDLLGQAFAERAGRRVEISWSRSAARSGTSWSTPLVNAKEAPRPPACPTGRARASSSPPSARRSAFETTPRRVGGLRTTPTSWCAQRGRRHDRGGAGRASPRQHYRKFNIKSEDLNTRRRLRHDARGPDAPLLPPPERRRGRAARNARGGGPRPLAGPRPESYGRRGPARTPRRPSSTTSASRTCRWWASRRESRPGTRGGRSSTCPAAIAVPPRAARSRPLLHPAPAGRGTPLRQSAPHRAHGRKKAMTANPARRNPRHPAPPASAPPPEALRNSEGRGGGPASTTSWKVDGISESVRPPRLRPLPRARAAPPAEGSAGLPGAPRPPPRDPRATKRSA